MFTGIVTDVGEVTRVEKNGDTRFVIATDYDTARVEIGASIACAGVCLTVVDKGAAPEGSQKPYWFSVDASGETLACSSLGGWTRGTRINLERALRVGDEIGGHIVSGHVDGVARVVSITPEGDSLRYQFEAPSDLTRYIASKGSITVEGVSLTVNEVEGQLFGVNIIPHTQSVTSLGDLSVGDTVNLEIDVLARYVARLQAAS
ncbi:MAG: riboflavin synthase [Alphaproteobacteria bacterium]|nr:MAG: riboflavin synthase [Alphaproteobacteria bacterium]